MCFGFKMKLPNYTGPYISDGKIQESVVFGTTVPNDALDTLSRLHDTAYATYKDYAHRRAADIIYYREAKRLEGLFPELAGISVLVGNQVGSAVTNLVDGALSGPIGFMIGATKNIYNLADFTMNKDKYIKDVLDLYSKDPVDFSQIIGKRPAEYNPYISDPIIDVDNADKDIFDDGSTLYNLSVPYTEDGVFTGAAETAGVRLNNYQPFSLGRKTRRRRK